MAQASATQYLAEIFAPLETAEQLRADSARLQDAAQLLTEAGEPVRYVRSLLVPCEETAFHLFEAETTGAVEHVLRDAGLEAERISVAIPANDRDRMGGKAT